LAGVIIGPYIGFLVFRSGEFRLFGLFGAIGGTLLGALLGYNLLE